jgi:hypothetical protein
MVMGGCGGKREGNEIKPRRRIKLTSSIHGSAGK